MNKPPLYLINGPLGAGKTTLLKFLISHEHFKKSRIIENEFASESVDTDTLHYHQSEIKTIAGECICCSDGNELEQALLKLAESEEPVIIEATGVANTLQLLEKIVVSGAINAYDLKQSIFVIDGAEASHDADSNLFKYKQEISATDTIILTKTDLLDETQLTELLAKIKTIANSEIIIANFGQFEIKHLDKQSKILEYYLNADEPITQHKIENNYNIIDVSDQHYSQSQIEQLWQKLKTKNQLRRLKGNFLSTNNNIVHIEATTAQCLFSEGTSNNLKLVFIGLDARSIMKEDLTNE